MGDTSGKSELDKYGVWVKNTVHPTADNNEEITSPIADDKDFLENTAISKAIATEVSKLDESPLQEMPTLQTDVLSSFIEQNAQAALLPPDTRAEAQNVDETTAAGESASEDTTAFAEDSVPPHGAQENGTSDVDLSAFTGDSFGGDVDLSTFMDDTPSPAGAQQESDGEVDLSAFMDSSPASSPDGEVDLSAFMDSSPASSPDGEVDLSDFLGGGDGEIDLTSFMGDSSFSAGKEEESQIQDEEPLDLDLEFEDSPFEIQDENATLAATSDTEQPDSSNQDDYQSLLGGFAQEAAQADETPSAASSGDEEIDLSAFGFEDSPDSSSSTGAAQTEKKVETVVDYVMNVDIEEEEEEESKNRDINAQDGYASDDDDDDDIKVDISQDSETAEQKNQEADFSSPDDSFDLDAIFSTIEDESGNAVDFFADEGSSGAQPSPDAGAPSAGANEAILAESPAQMDDAAGKNMESFLQTTAQADAHSDESAATFEPPDAILADAKEDELPPIDTADVQASEKDAALDLPQKESATPVSFMEDEGFAEGKDFLKEKGLLEEETPAEDDVLAETEVLAEDVSDEDTTVASDEVSVEPEWDIGDETAITEDELESIENELAEDKGNTAENVSTFDIIDEEQETPFEETRATQKEETQQMIPPVDSEELETLTPLDLPTEEEPTILEQTAAVEPITEGIEKETQTDNATADKGEAEAMPLTLQADELASFHEPVPVLNEAALDMTVLSKPADLDEVDEAYEGESSLEPVLTDEMPNEEDDNSGFESGEDAKLMAKDKDVEENEQKTDNDEVEAMNDDEKKKADDLDVSSYIDKGPDYDMTGVTVTLDDLEKMEETPVVEPEIPSPAVQEEGSAQATEQDWNDTQKQVYSVFVCSGITSSGEIVEENAQEEEEKPKEKESESVAILQKIAQELESLKTEISSLRDEFEQFKQSGISAPSSQDDESAQQEEGGFFNDDDGDDTIALSGDELSNILSTAEFTSQDAESLEQEEELSAETPASTEESAVTVETDEVPQTQEEAKTEQSIEDYSEAQPTQAQESAVEESTEPSEQEEQEPQEDKLEAQTESLVAEPAVAAEPLEDNTQESEPSVEQNIPPEPLPEDNVQEIEPEITQVAQVPEAQAYDTESPSSETERVPEIGEVYEQTDEAQTEDVNQAPETPMETQQISTDAQETAASEQEGSQPDVTEKLQEEAGAQEAAGGETGETGETAEAEAAEQLPQEAGAEADVQQSAPEAPEVQEQTTDSETQIAAEPEVEEAAETEVQESAGEPVVQQIQDEAQQDSEATEVAPATEPTAESQSEQQQAAGVISDEDIPSPTLESLNLPTLSETYQIQEEEAEPLTEDNIEYLKSDVPEEFEEEEENIETGISEQPVDVFSNWSAKGEIEEEASEPEAESTVAESEEEISLPKPQSEPEAAAEEAIKESEIAQQTEGAPDEAHQVVSTSVEGTGDLMAQIKTVLTYMDRLLENLPEEKIEEFARSEQFETYKKLFIELGLA